MDFLAQDIEAALFLAVIFGMVANQLVMRVGGLYARRSVFWSLQAANLVIGTAVIGFGLPGLPRAVSWFVALLFFFRTIVNNNLRLRWLEAELSGPDDDQEEQREALRAALRRAAEEDSERASQEVPGP